MIGMEFNRNHPDFHEKLARTLLAQDEEICEDVDVLIQYLHVHPSEIDYFMEEYNLSMQDVEDDIL